MPKSKRDKKISLTRVEKKAGLETKAALVEKVRESVDNYARLFVFQVENMRNNKLKAVRETWSHSKFFIGKNRVLMKALGVSEEEEYSDNLHLVSRCIKNECGLLLTNQDREEVIKFFDSHQESDFARTGGVATETLELEEGPLPQFSHSMEPHLRKLGLPVHLVKGVVSLFSPFTVCREGETLTSEQANILKLLGHQQAQFRLRLVAVWSKEGGKFEVLADMPSNAKSNSEGEDEEGSGMEDDE